MEAREKPSLLLLQPRSLRTREKLLEAATKCLIERGYAGASTTLVAQEAGVSQGALFKHFPDKTALLGACMRATLAGLVARFRKEVKAKLPKGGVPDDRLKVGVAALWRVFRRKEMKAVYELFMAARTDAALEEALASTVAEHRATILEEAKALFPEGASHPEFAMAIDAVVYAMQGASLELFVPARGEDARLLAMFERMARNELNRLFEIEVR